MAKTGDDSRSGDVMRTLDRAVSAMLTRIVKKLKAVLSRHVAVSTQVISNLIPEFLYYILLGRVCGAPDKRRIFHVQTAGMPAR